MIIINKDIMREVSLKEMILKRNQNYQIMLRKELIVAK